jgi:Family of unknown function (DUF6519)
MYLDSSRSRFDPTKHYSRVLTLQGRVSLDSDDDEQGAILMHYLRTAISDIVGPAACPQESAGFEVGTETNDRVADLTLSTGRMYVDGLLVENEADTSYWNQPDGYLDADLDKLPTDGPYVAYLRVWERSVSALQDPDIREVALGIHGPDTTARSKVVWQLAVHGFDGEDPGDTAEQEWQTWVDSLDGGASLRAKAIAPADAELDICSISPSARYRGEENQHYRVEIVRSGPAEAGLLGKVHVIDGGDDARVPAGRAAKRTAPAAKATKGRKRAAVKAVPQEEPPARRPLGASASAQFVWSRENGSVEFAIDALDGAEVTLDSLGRDIPSGLEIGDWVEVCDDASSSRVAADVDTGLERAFFEVTALDPVNRVVTLDRDPVADIGETGRSPELHPLLRRWDSAGPVSLVEGSWLQLEDGVQVWFEGSGSPKTPTTYRSGDYWLIPARLVTGDVIWPQDADGPAAVPPHGIDYHYAALAFVPVDGAAVTDLRKTFLPIGS